MVARKFFITESDDAINAILANVFVDQLVPELARLVNDAGKRLAEELGYSNPFEVDEAVNRVVWEVAGLLTLHRPNDAENLLHIQPSQLTPTHARAWFQLAAEEGE